MTKQTPYKSFSEEKKQQLREYNRIQYANLTDEQKTFRQGKKIKYYWDNHEKILAHNRQRVNQKKKKRNDFRHRSLLKG